MVISYTADDLNEIFESSDFLLNYDTYNKKHLKTIQDLQLL